MDCLKCTHHIEYRNADKTKNHVCDFAGLPLKNDFSLEVDGCIHHVTNPNLERS
jgi:hypothetical protein